MSEVRIVGEQTNGKCGYCKTGNNTSFGLVCDKMRVSVYEDLMLKGWRRSGNYYYKPQLKKSCCKLNTIRCEASRYEPNNAQRKVLKRFERHLSGKVKKPINKAKNRKIRKEIMKVNDELKQRSDNAVRMASDELGIPYNPKFNNIKRNPENQIEKFGHYSLSAALAFNACLKLKNLDTNLEEISQVLEKHIKTFISNSP